MKQPILLFLSLFFIPTGIFAQKQNIYLIKNDGQYVATRDSADYIRVVQEPDQGSELYIINEFYKDGKVKSMGLSRKVDPPLYEGLYRSLYNNGKKKQVANFKQGKLIGQVYDYYPNGKLYTIYSYEEAQPGTLLPRYKILEVNDSTGKSLVKDGKGDAALYDHEFKQIVSRGRINNGEYDGVWTGEDPSIQVTYKEIYEQGKLISGESTGPDNVTLNYTQSHIQPQYKGGMENFYRYLGRSIRYPAEAQRRGVQGVVVLKFFVETDGSLSNIRIVNYVDEELGAEAVRILKQSPNWTPGVMRGRKVRVAYNVPISFSLSR